MSLGEVVQKYPETAEILMKHGMHCFGCPMATMETIEQGIAAHPEINLEMILKELNEAVEKATPEQSP